jgi:predicted RNA binding protein YcfA (HicA-like mRNA interferase family)
MHNYPLPYSEVKKKLEKSGFSIVSQKGSHIKFAKFTKEGTITTIVPNQREITLGTLKSIIKQAMLTEDEFENA